MSLFERPGRACYRFGAHPLPLHYQILCPFEFSLDSHLLSSRLQAAVKKSVFPLNIKEDLFSTGI